MRNTIILAVIAIALAAYVYFVEIKGGEQKKKEKEIAEKLFNVKKDSIDHIIIEKNGTTFEFVKKDDVWQIVRPIQTLADESPINSVLYSLSNTKKIRTFKAEGKDLATYGLGAQCIKVVFSGKGVAEQWVKIGDRTPVGANVFVTKDDSIVAIVASSIKNTMDKSLFDWRDKKAIHFKKDQIKEFTLKNRYGKFHFVKEGNNWKLTEPVEARGDNGNINSILNKLEFGRIKSVAAETPEHLSEYGLTAPAIRIELFSGMEKAKLGVSFSRLKGNRAYGKDDSRPHIFEVDSFFVKPFKKKLYDLRDKYIAKFNRNKAQRIKLLFNSELMIFEKDSSNNWALSTGEKAKNYKISNLISHLNNLKVARFVDDHPKNLKKYGLDMPRGLVEVYNDNDEKILELLVGKDRNEDEFYAQVPEQKSVVTFKKSSLKDIFPEKEDLIEKPKEEKKQETKAEEK
ncbi:DUF4340 domain-containing protein [Caldithrix abyssi]